MAKMPHLASFMTSTMFLFCSLSITILNTTNADVGVCYGMLGDNLPSKQEVIALYNQNNIQRMRLYVRAVVVLGALVASTLGFLFGFATEVLERIANSQAEADAWVQNNIKNYPNVKIRYIAVGNEINPGDSAAQFLVPAMEKIQSSLSTAGLGIKVSSAIHTGTLGESYPPSKGSFNREFKPILDPLIQFLVNNNSPLLVNVYPYFSYTQNMDQISLDYALFTASGPVVFDDQLHHLHLYLRFLLHRLSSPSTPPNPSIPLQFIFSVDRANLANVRSQEVSFNDEVAVAFEKKIVSFIVENAVKNELNKAYSKKAKKTRHSADLALACLWLFLFHVFWVYYDKM
ncbi:hypothetical protein SLEP1_g36802 [Rubroshorea leprosula]|uniref:glucan endo-1,3-beta-D-glucosidase n=1 Tax=Rubroshorea leprosula TaxID=152421 RepID=A0AAV5KSW3_9ROSI|nr:hypothetical protein SLEP1_g36802 [Rubroshorea leprosula]